MQDLNIFINLCVTNKQGGLEMFSKINEQWSISKHLAEKQAIDCSLSCQLIMFWFLINYFELIR